MDFLKHLTRSKEKVAIRQAKALRKTLTALGYKKPKKGEANCINVWEFDDGRMEITELESNIEIKF